MIQTFAQLQTFASNDRTLFVISLFSSYGDKEALYNGEKWLSYNMVLFPISLNKQVLNISDIISDIVVKYTRTNRPVCVIGDFSSYKCCGNFNSTR